MLGQSSGSRKGEDHQLVVASATSSVASAFAPTSSHSPFARTPLINSTAVPVAPLSFTWPCAEQEVAVNTLKDFDDDSVIAWLTLLRSIQPGPGGLGLRSGAGNLSTEQLDALSILQDCRIENVLAWLQFARLAGQ